MAKAAPRPTRAYQRLPGLAVCPDCFTLLVYTGHSALAFQRRCSCFACWHYDLFATPEGWDVRQQWSAFGTTACAAYAEAERDFRKQPKPQTAALQLSSRS